MLILDRRADQKAVIGHGQQLWVTGPLGALVPIDPIELTVVRVRGGKAVLGFSADPRVSIHRSEVCEVIDAEIAAREAERTAGFATAATA